MLMLKLLASGPWLREVMHHNGQIRTELNSILSLRAALLSTRNFLFMVKSPNCL